jgi:hypothetical protein
VGKMNVLRNYQVSLPRVFTIIVIVLLIGIILISNYFSNKNIERLTTEYKYIEKYMKVSEIVKEFETDRGTSHIETLSGNKIWIDGASNFNYSPHDLDNFLMKGDTIMKHNGSDTLFIHRKHKKYFFVLSADVGNDPCRINVGKWFKK